MIKCRLKFRFQSRFNYRCFYNNLFTYQIYDYLCKNMNLDEFWTSYESMLNVHAIHNAEIIQKILTSTLGAPMKLSVAFVYLHESYYLLRLEALDFYWNQYFFNTKIRFHTSPGDRNFLRNVITNTAPFLEGRSANYINFFDSLGANYGWMLLAAVKAFALSTNMNTLPMFLMHLDSLDYYELFDYDTNVIITDFIANNSDTEYAILTSNSILFDSNEISNRRVVEANIKFIEDFLKPQNKHLHEFTDREACVVLTCLTIGFGLIACALSE